MRPYDYTQWLAACKQMERLAGVRMVEWAKAPTIPGWHHGANSAAATPEEAMAQYAGCWNGSVLRAEPFSPCDIIHFAIYFRVATDEEIERDYAALAASMTAVTVADLTVSQ